MVDRARRPTGVVLDPRSIRVLAHPVRSRLLSALRRDGPANATTLARALDTNTGATSYHLRKLAEVGLVAETDAGQGRERWWRAAHDQHSWSASTVADDPDAQAASTWLEREYLHRFTESAEQWLASKDRWPLAWRDAAGSSDYLLELSPTQLRAMLDELSAVVDRYRRAGDAAAEPDDPADPAARQVSLHLHAYPRPRAGEPQP